MQNEGALAIGTQVSAKYKGAFCEAKVRSVDKLVKCRVTFKMGLGSTTISDKDIKTDKPLTQGATVLAKHPDKQDYFEAVVKEIKDQSRYTVIFNDGDIATLRRNALCMKSGKHYNASESLDNLPLTHPEHFSTPVSGSRRRAPRSLGSSVGSTSASGQATGTPAQSDDEDSSSDGEDVASSYLSHIGRVVWAENTDKKSKSKDSWFPALIVAPSASDTVKIDTKEEFLIRSFKDGRYYTVSKKDTNKFHKEAAKRADKEPLRDVVEKAVAYLERDELPPHWDKEILFNMGEDSATESSESEEMDEDDLEPESPEDKDHLVAELYKHMEDRGAPINRTPTIDGREVDLYKLFKCVAKLGGHARVTNKSLWHQVAKTLGFETAWCINQVRVHYKRYLQSFEQLNRTLGCTMRTNKLSSQGGRSQIRGLHSRAKESSHSPSQQGPQSDASQDTPSQPTTPLPPAAPASPTATPSSAPSEPSSQSTVMASSLPAAAVVASSSSVSTSCSSSLGPTAAGVVPVEKEEEQEIEMASEAPPASPPVVQATTTAAVAEPVGSALSSDTEGHDHQDASAEPASHTVKGKATAPSSKAKGRRQSKGTGDDRKMKTRPRRDSTSSLAAAMQVKAQKENLGCDLATPGSSSKKTSLSSSCSTTSSCSSAASNADGGSSKKTSTASRSEKELPVEKEANTPSHCHSKKWHSATPAASWSSASCGAASPAASEEEKVTPGRKSKMKKMAKREPREDDELEDDEKQNLAPHIEVNVGDRIKVFYKRDTIYDAKVIKMQKKDNEDYPRYYVHYQGWNARYDEWIKRSRIADNLSWNKDKGNTSKKSCMASETVKPSASTASSSSSATSVPSSGLLSTASSSSSGAASVPSKASPHRSETPTSTRGSRTESPATFRRQTSRTNSEETVVLEEEPRKSTRLQKVGRKPKVSVAKPVLVQRQKRGAASGVNTSLGALSTSTSTSTPPTTDAPKAKRGRKAGSTKAKPAVSPATAVATASTTTPPSTSSTASVSTPVKKGTPGRKPKVSNRPPTETAVTTVVEAPATASCTPASSTVTASNVKTEDPLDDPYAFKEPEPLDESKLLPPPQAASTDAAKKSPPAWTAKKTTKKKSDSDSNDSSDESVRKGGKEGSLSKKVCSEEEPETETLTEVQQSSPPCASTTTPLTPVKAADEDTATTSADILATPIKSEPEEDDGKGGRPILQMTKKEQELFPHLAAFRASSLLPKVELEPPAVETAAAVSTPQKRKAACSLNSRSSKKQRKTPKKPNSSELVESEESESDADKGLAAGQSEAKEQVPLKRLPALDFDEDEPLSKKASTVITCSIAADHKKGATVSRKTDDESQVDLACAETIPGSPVANVAPEVSESGPPEQPELEERHPDPSLESPFASVPESVSPASSAKTSSGHGSFVALVTVNEESSGAPVSQAATASGSGKVEAVPEEQQDSSSSHPPVPVDSDGLSGQPKSEVPEAEKPAAPSEKEAVVGGKKSACSASAGAGHGGSSAKKNKAELIRSPKRRRRTRGGTRAARNKASADRHAEDACDLDDHKGHSSSIPALGSLDNEALAALAQRSSRSKKYNFFVDLNSSMDSAEKIQLIENSLKELRKTYMNVKSDLAMIERRRKKIKRKERERAEKNMAVEAAA